LFIIQTVEKLPVDRAAFEEQKSAIRAQMAAGVEQERWARFLAALKERAKVMDFRSEVLRATQADA
nr:hypothetical protein [Gammaproteobacteria bacterium]